MIDNSGPSSTEMGLKMSCQLVKKKRREEKNEFYDCHVMTMCSFSAWGNFLTC